MCWTKLCPLHALLTPWSTPILQIQMQIGCQKSVEILGSFFSKNCFILTSILQEVWRVCERTRTPEISRCPIIFNITYCGEASLLLTRPYWLIAQAGWGYLVHRPPAICGVLHTFYPKHSILFHHSLWHSFLWKKLLAKPDVTQVSSNVCQ